MKNFFTILLAALAITVSASSAMAQTQSVTIKLGAHCDHFEMCETGKTRLEKELAYTKGVKDIKTDSQAKIITVKYNSKKATEQSIREAIAKAGYDADDVKADPKGYAKLDDCCKKKE